MQVHAPPKESVKFARVITRILQRISVRKAKSRSSLKASSNRQRTQAVATGARQEKKDELMDP